MKESVCQVHWQVLLLCPQGAAGVVGGWLGMDRAPDKEGSGQRSHRGRWDDLVQRKGPAPSVFAGEELVLLRQGHLRAPH